MTEKEIATALEIINKNEYFKFGLLDHHVVNGEIVIEDANFPNMFLQHPIIQQFKQPFQLYFRITEEKCLALVIYTLPSGREFIDKPFKG